MKLEYDFNPTEALENVQIPGGLILMNPVELTTKQYENFLSLASEQKSKKAVFFKTYTNHRAFETKKAKAISLSIIGYTRGNRQYRINKTVFVAFI